MAESPDRNCRSLVLKGGEGHLKCFCLSGLDPEKAGEPVSDHARISSSLWTEM
jgi:hypothetical protein